MPFRVVVSEHDEDLHDGEPVRTVERNARGKAEEVLARVRLRPGELVLGVDTVVVVDGRVLGKAAGEQEAAEYLRLLAGRRHEVYSGLHLCSGERGVTAHAVTGVTFRPLAPSRHRALRRLRRVARARRRLRHPGRRLGSREPASTATTSTSSACRCGPAGRRSPPSARRRSPGCRTSRPSEIERRRPAPVSWRELAGRRLSWRCLRRAYTIVVRHLTERSSPSASSAS